MTVQPRDQETQGEATQGESENYRTTSRLLLARRLGRLAGLGSTRGVDGDVRVERSVCDEAELVSSPRFTRGRGGGGRTGDPVHPLLRVDKERRADSGDDAARQEDEPHDLVAVNLSLLERGRCGAEDLTRRARDRRDPLAGREPNDEGADVRRVEAERNDGLDCWRRERGGSATTRRGGLRTTTRREGSDARMLAGIWSLVRAP